MQALQVYERSSQMESKWSHKFPTLWELAAVAVGRVFDFGSVGLMEV